MRTLGATGLSVSPIGLGLAALGRPGYINLGHAGDVGDTDVAGHGAPRPRGARRGLRGRRALLRRGALLRARRGLPGLVARTPRPLAQRRDGRLEVGLHLHRRLAGRRRRARGQGPLGRARCAGSSARRARCIGEHLALYQIHSATLESGVLDDAEVREELARLREAGVRDRPHRHRAAPGRDDRARARGRRLRRRAGDLEPARALGHRRAGRRARGRARRDRQGGPGQRAPDRARRRRRPADRRRARARDDARRAGARRRPRPAVGRRRPQRRGDGRHPAQQPGGRSTSTWDARAEEALAPLAEPADEYWERRSELAWN